jgi:hypothetical protein
MPWSLVESYTLRYNTKEKTAQVDIKYSEAAQIYSATLPGSDATFLADLLRFEKPVYFDPDTGVISTSDEPVGAEEHGG